MNTRVFAIDAGPAAKAFRNACRLDVAAFKPGNVSIASSGHGMRAEDFIVSAEAAAPAPFAPTLWPTHCAGHEATRRAVSCNTNLGIVTERARARGADAFEHCGAGRLQSVLAGLTIRDAERAYRAIRLASPGARARRTPRCCGGSW
jgi:triphosphoribosyl-dephospho-CoA synthase